MQFVHLGTPGTTSYPSLHVAPLWDAVTRREHHPIHVVARGKESSITLFVSFLVRRKAAHNVHLYPDIPSNMKTRVMCFESNACAIAKGANVVHFQKGNARHVKRAVRHVSFFIPSSTSAYSNSSCECLRWILSHGGSLERGHGAETCCRLQLGNARPLLRALSRQLWYVFDVESNLQRVQCGEARLDGLPDLLLGV